MKKYQFLIITVIFLLVVAGLFLSSGPPHSDSLTVQSDSRNEDTVIFQWVGDIDPPMSKVLLHEFREVKDRYSRIILDLNSPGGSVDEGEKMIKAIRKMKRTHKVRTYVADGNQCLSMCVPIYMEGTLRVAAASSLWMFHQPYAVDPLTGEPQFRYNNERQRSSTMFYTRFFEETDIDKKWLKNLQIKWQDSDVWRTGRELKRERSNIVMMIE